METETRASSGLDPLLSIEDLAEHLGVPVTGVRQIRRRADRAGIEGFHPHKLRHTAAHRWLAKGGTGSGLMTVAGWTRSDMLVRYTRARASERAAQEARRPNPGDLQLRVRPRISK